MHNNNEHKVKRHVCKVDWNFQDKKNQVHKCCARTLSVNSHFTLNCLFTQTTKTDSDHKI